MAEYSLYFGTHSAHKANAWILRLWLKTWACLFKTKGLKINHSLLFMYFLWIFVQSETHKTKAGIMNCCERLWATTMIKKTMSDCQKWAGLFTTTRWKGGGSGGAETTTWNKVLALHQAIWAASESVYLQECFLGSEFSNVVLHRTTKLLGVCKISLRVSGRERTADTFSHFQ